MTILSRPRPESQPRDENDQADHLEYMEFQHQQTDVLEDYLVEVIRVQSQVISRLRHRLSEATGEPLKMVDLLPEERTGLLSKRPNFAGRVQAGFDLPAANTTEGHE